MKIGMIGLGRMGANMAKRLMKDGHECVVYDLNAANVQGLVKEGATGATSIEDFLARLPKPRVAWVMVPAGEPTEKTIMGVAAQMEKGDIVIDGGNSFFKDDIRRAKVLAEKGVHYCDVGTSGGIWGYERGYCLMIGGNPEAVKRLDPIFKTLAPGRSGIEPSPGRKSTGTSTEGYLHCGPVGSGHFVKMIHNGIEYGLMQAFAEGFDIMKNAGSESLAPDHRFDLDLGEIAEVWRRGSVVSSWLLDLTAMALAESPKLEEYEGFVQDSGEGRWTVMAAIEEAVPADVLSAALYTRFRSRQSHTFAEKILSAMRKKFGGHTETPAGH